MATRHGETVKARALDSRRRDKSGEIRQKRGDTLNKNLARPFPQFRGDTTVDVMRQITGANDLRSIQQVVERGRGDWAVRRVGSERATKVFPSQKEAVVFAREIAKKQGDTLYIHGRDGSVQRKASFRTSEASRKSNKR
jgi:hypothetical protein